MSSPCWEKHFDDLWSLKEELEPRVCNLCKHPELDPLLRQCGYVMPSNYVDLPMIEQLAELLNTACGLEYFVSDNVMTFINNYYDKKEKSCL